ncbi:peptide/nickel transport system permease protein [Maritalea mobilis]|uniref:Peptide/nickel transport system permease protein n=1 Tax=Maritalea mobilis TaxID=483324 RepID=A0A4R6VP76_9HYPH|nr:ABC transporter permease [Maritalea mobilis]TDQ64016.1 peptide/nickel transport system permease protein [Maritalea mobilis]
MVGYLIQRLLGVALTLLVAAALIFFLLDVLPGDPARFMLGINASDEALNALRQQLGLDQPAFVRFGQWLMGLFTGDLGMSASQRAPIAELILERMQLSLPLAFGALVLSTLIGLPLGILAAQNQGKIGDAGLMGLAQIGIAIPNFWFAMLLVVVFAVTLKWLPPGGFVPWAENPAAAFRALILPTIALALPQAAILARVMRTSLVDVARQDFIRTARAKGLSKNQALWRHGVRNALLPVMTIMGLQFAFLIAGTIIVENVFYLPGLGRLIFTAISARDLFVVRSALLVLVGLVVIIMFLVDLLYALVDPRLKKRAGN